LGAQTYNRSEAVRQGGAVCLGACLWVANQPAFTAAGAGLDRRCENYSLLKKIMLLRNEKTLLLDANYTQIQHPFFSDARKIFKKTLNQKNIRRRAVRFGENCRKSAYSDIWREFRAATSGIFC
jgi:hypothetical protein